MFGFSRVYLYGYGEAKVRTEHGTAVMLACRVYTKAQPACSTVSLAAGIGVIE